MTHWHEHDGGSWPEEAHPEDQIEVQYRDGSKCSGRVVSFWDEKDENNLWMHSKYPDIQDILRYRLIDVEN